jgi:hypothetical protein
MRNNTFEDYKKAIQAKYEVEKEGVYFNFLSPPSQANLRNLCWEIFNSNTNSDDLKTFHSFFDFEFDLEKRNHFKEQTDRFRPIGSFLKGEKVPSNRFAVELAAILVDFQPRPYKKYKERGIIGLEHPVKNPNIPEVFLMKPLEEIPKNKSGEEENYKEEPEQDNGSPSDKLMAIATFGAIDVKIEDKEEVKQDVKGVVIINGLSLKSRLFDKLFKRSKSTMLAVTLIFCLIAAVIYLAFIKKDCMQWTGDHYEIVDCTSEISRDSNDIIPLDKNLLDFRKIEVCDTTTCFKKNGDPIVWYSKNNNQVEFFNKDGKNPINDKRLRRITAYIFTKYKGSCVQKKSKVAK